MSGVCHIMKNCSTMYRLYQAYFSQKMEPYGLGAGQHYFLEEIHRHPGITMAMLAGQGAYDSGTVTRAVRRLEACKYVRVEPDEADRRVKRLYTTPEGEDLFGVIRALRRELYSQVMLGLTEEETAQADQLMQRTADNMRLAIAPYVRTEARRESSTQNGGLKHET